MQKIVSCSLSPNTEADDVAEAVRVFCNPTSWQQGEAVDAVERWFGGISFDSGRTALLALLRAFGIGSGDDVLLQAFTCAAVPRSIAAAGARPVYVDIDDRFNVDPRDVSQKISSRARAIIVEHTFGLPASMDDILAMARKNRLLVIEDCAHSLGATYHGKQVGTMGDAAFFSFGRDKVISSVWGGAARISATHKAQREALRAYQRSLPMPSCRWIAQQLLHPVALSLIVPSYTIILGKVMLEAMKRMRLLSLPNPSSMGEPRRYPNALAQLLVRQLAKLTRYNAQRRRIASRYHEAFGQGEMVPGAIYLRYPLFVANPVRTIRDIKRRGILLGNWYHEVLDVRCTRSRDAAGRIVNLPTLIGDGEAERVIHALQLD